MATRDLSAAASPADRALPSATRARLGCELVASKMKIGLIFESILKRGLLEFASTCPTGHRSSVTPTTRSSRRRSTH